jgi:hypothetical protein
MVFHFQFRGSGGWEPIGAGVGGGDDPIAEALEEIRGFAGGKLPAGTYQVIEPRSSDTRWQTFDLGEDGEIISDPEPQSADGAVCTSAGGEGTSAGSGPADGSN